MDMLTEWSASFPKEAHQSLAKCRSYYRRIMPGSRKLTEEIYLHWENLGDGLIGYEIRLTPKFEEEYLERISKLESELSQYGREALAEIRKHNRGWDLHWSNYEESGFATHEITIPFDYLNGEPEVKLGIIFDHDLTILKKVA